MPKLRNRTAEEREQETQRVAARVRKMERRAGRSRFEPMDPAEREFARSASRWRYSLRSKYGITAEQYAYMLTKQDGICAICKRPPTGKMPLVVDHKGPVRGLLCNKCNAALGLFGDDPIALANAISYLEEARRRKGRNIIPAGLE